MKPIVEEIAVGELHYAPEYKLLFIRETEGLVPIMYDVEAIEHNGEISYNGIEIEQNRDDVFYLWTLFVKRTGIQKDLDGIKKKGFLETFQYHISIQILLKIINQKNEDIMSAVSRQGYYGSV